jgi:hypothetical protein
VVYIQAPDDITIELAYYYEKKPARGETKIPNLMERADAPCRLSRDDLAGAVHRSVEREFATGALVSEQMTKWPRALVAAPGNTAYIAGTKAAVIYRVTF